MRTILYRQRMLGALWWTQARVDDKKERAAVLGHWREDAALKKYKPTYIIDAPGEPRPLVESEDGQRTVVGLNVEGKVYEVTNPQNVFSYGAMKTVSRKGEVEGKVASS